ncbi:uncharacterized protein LOC106077126 [Biomphalaria glabrata]|uniref:Uncharacterized protein LOC106077126 n=2 Tax=Biomphalaria glabrata TaxID=6526 RepID=A0A9W2ZHI8_BIOGL|nr:uncharacterized protein LOC106077126 [Biomphalaria glabrata]XP_055874390.1 uncharacterized protein LOC106077126 [Biomphalaria glabrata]
MSLTDHQFSEADSRLVVHSAPSSRGDSSVYDKVHFDFYTKTLHDAHDALLQTRSAHFRRRPAEQEKDIWKRKPPDFRYVVYDPHPPKRNTVDSMQPWRYGTIPGQREIIKRVRSEGHLPRLLEDDSNDEGTQFKTRFRFERPFTAKKKFVASGSNKPGEYESPKPHDFRGYPPIKSLGLDEFVTDYEKDPNGMKFKTQRLNHIFGLPNEPPERDLVPGRQMGKPMSGKKHWDPQLVLEKDDWPRKSAAFTRHRRRHRQAYSAFMERVEDALNSAWTQEMFSKEILSQ